MFALKGLRLQRKLEADKHVKDKDKKKKKEQNHFVWWTGEEERNVETR